MISLLGIVPDYDVYGPGAFSYTSVLEEVSERRIKYGYGLSDIEGYDILVAPSDCSLLGKDGWIISAQGIHSMIAVDCESDIHKGTMQTNGILADVNTKELKKGWLIFK